MEDLEDHFAMSTILYLWCSISCDVLMEKGHMYLLLWI